MRDYENYNEMKFCDPETVNEITQFDYSQFDESDYEEENYYQED